MALVCAQWKLGEFGRNVEVIIVTIEKHSIVRIAAGKITATTGGPDRLEPATGRSGASTLR